MNPGRSNIVRAAWLAGIAGLLLSVPAGAATEERGYPVFPVVFFPPTPPVYGAPIQDDHATAARIIGGRRLVAPGGMADFVGDAIYPALATRLYALDLNPSLEARLQAYRTRRNEQVNLLLNELVSLHDAAPEEREQRLRAFARQQTPALVALEAEGERLRRDLIADGWLNRIDWNANRRWRVGSFTGGADGAAAEAEFQVIRAAAYYQNGFIAQQRGLLRELAIELKSAVRKARGLPAAREDSDAMFFSPETARFRLPSNLPAAVREKIATFNGRKAELKRELREAVLAYDGASATVRERAMQELADRQWPQFGLLEELAEEIRHDLAKYFEVAAPPAPPWIPAGLLEMIRAYNKDRDDYFGELKQRIAQAQASVPKPDVAVPLDERVQRHRDYMDRRAAAVREATLEFQRENAERFAVLEERYRVIRESLGLVAEKQVDRRTGRPLDADTLLRQYVASMKEFDEFGRISVIYTNYRIAMLEPGLSPEQRRLLFAYALAGLAQPLPHGEPMPRRNATRPYPSS